MTGPFDLRRPRCRAWCAAPGTASTGLRNYFFTPDFITFHFHPLSSFGNEVLIGLHELNIPHTKHIVDIGDDASRATFPALWPSKSNARRSESSGARSMVAKASRYTPAAAPSMPSSDSRLAPTRRRRAGPSCDRSRAPGWHRCCGAPGAGRIVTSRPPGAWIERCQARRGRGLRRCCTAPDRRPARAARSVSAPESTEPFCRVRDNIELPAMDPFSDGLTATRRADRRATPAMRAPRHWSQWHAFVRLARGMSLASACLAQNLEPERNMR